MFRSLSVSTAARVPLIMMRRGLATASHEPPKKLHGHTGRYAMATYTAASKAGLKEKVEGELQAFADTLKKSPNLAAYLANPTIPRPEKTNKMSDLFDEKKFSFVTRNLFLTLSLNGRVGEAVKVIHQYQELMAASRGSVKVSVTSAEPLKKKQLETIQAAVTKMVGTGKTVDIEQKVDASLLSGLQLLVGDKFLDLSVNNRIKQLSAALDNTAAAN